MKPWDRENGGMVDVTVIEALPSVLGQSISYFNNVMVEAMCILSRHTVGEGAAQFDAELSGVGGSIEGLAKDQGSSSSSSGGSLSSGTGGSSRGGRRGSSRGGRHGSSNGRGHRRGARAMADKCLPACPGPVAGCGLRTPLVFATGSSGVWGQGGLRVATLAPRLHVRCLLFAPSAAVGLRLPCRPPLTAMRS